MPRFVHLLVGLLLLIGLLPTIQPAAAVQPVSAPGDSVFGVNSHTASRYPELGTMNRAVDLVANSGAGWVREDFQWSRLEPQSGEFDWMFHDEMVAQYRAEGINILGVLNGPTPAWSSGSSGNDFTAPDAAGFAEFARQVVTRYADDITYWQIWNEPDNSLYWQPAPDIPAYTQLLNTTSQAVRAANPNARVVLAGMVSPEPAASTLQTIADNGGWGAFDIIAIHPYTDPFEPEGLIDTGVGAVRSVSERLGAKPIWATEFGWATDVGGRGGVAFSEEDQANLLVRGAVLLRSAGVERIFWYKLKDENNPEKYGLVRLGSGPTDYSQPKPSYYAFTTLNQQLAGTISTQSVELGSRSIMLDFENFGSWTRGDQPNGTFTQSTAQSYTGNASGQLSYTFTSSGNDFVVFNSGSRPQIEPGATQLGVWVYGDSSGHALKVWLTDAQGEQLQYRLGFIGGDGWQFLSTPINNPVQEFDRISGGGNLLLDLPARLDAIVLDDEPDGSAIQNGSIYLDDMTAVSGPEAYGVRFGQNAGSVVDVLWAPQDGLGFSTIPTQSNPATQVDRSGGVSNPTSDGGVFNIPLGTSPIYLIHIPGTLQTPPPPPPPPSENGQPAPPAPGGEERCFDATGYCISGRIRQFWEQNGGLAVFGYPTTAQRSETIEGQTLQVQWFERNRLELHPENAPPYDVLIGLVGLNVLQENDRNWQDFPNENTMGGTCLNFDETGHSVCGEFLDAWRASGLDLDLDGVSGENDEESLALFGLPISAPRTERLSDGNEYTVQWFQRARFELHPENPQDTRVLFGLLGNELLTLQEGGE